MIHRLDSDLPTFKPLTFRPGLNILLAEKSEGASDRQSRNGAGKTSFLEILHFILGGDARPDSIFRSDALRDWTFRARVDVGSAPVSAARSGGKPSAIRLSDADHLEFDDVLPGGSSENYLKNEDWKRVLGHHWFSLPREDDGNRFQPTFRSLFSFFARRHFGGGFERPTQHAAAQQTWDQQVSTSYLLGLDWKVSSRFQELREQERSLRALRKAVRSGDLGRYLGRAPELRTQLTLAESKVGQLRRQLDAFRVVDEYSELEQEADRLTGETGHIAQQNAADQALVKELRAALDVEDPPALGDLEGLYKEAGVVLPELVRHRLDDVQRFHRAIVENRRTHLDAEIRSAEQRMDQRNGRRAELDGRRRQIMQILDSGGALEHYTALREELGRMEGDSEALRQRLADAERLDNTKAELDIDRTRLIIALRTDIRERSGLVGNAIRRFEELSQSLYERAGSLTIADTRNGPNVEVHIDAERSRGITSMQIFCFDLMLAEMCAEQSRFPRFLVHDSHLFDGVDERQVAKALQLGAERAERFGFQYIVTLNSDAIPREGFSRGFDVRDHALETILTDATETGGLFGMRFN